MEKHQKDIIKNKKYITIPNKILFSATEFSIITISINMDLPDFPKQPRIEKMRIPHVAEKIKFIFCKFAFSS